MARKPSQGSGKKKGRGTKAAVEAPSDAGRRRFLQLAGLTTGMAGLDLVACTPGEDAGTVEVEDGLVVRLNLRVEALRPRDFVVLRFEFVNIGLNLPRTLLVPESTAAKYIIVTHAPQHVFEQCFLEIPDDPPPLQSINKPVGARLAGPSRVVFKVPSTFTSVAYNLPALLELIGKLDMSVNLNATPRKVTQSTTAGLINGQSFSTFDNQFTSQSSAIIQRNRLAIGDQQLARSLSVPAAENFTVSQLSTAPNVATLKPGLPLEPTSTQTSLEIPWRLQMSPNSAGAWAHSPTEVEHNGRVELWHSRLGVRNKVDGSVDEKSTALRTMRALWTRDDGFDRTTLNDSTTPDPFLSPLIGSDRIKIVHNTSNFLAPEHATYVPDPVDVNRLMLTGLGAWFDVHGEWKPTLNNLESWDNRTTHGRDHYVKVVYAGFLYPWRHRASLVVVTERKFQKDKFGQGDEHVAFLWTRVFVIVREPLVNYTANAASRGAPFLKIGVKQLVTPNLSTTELELTNARNGSAPLLLKLSGTEPYRFPLEATDRTGRLLRFNGSAVWVPSIGSGLINPTRRTQARTLYTTNIGTTPTARASFSGQRIAFGKPDRVDDTTYETDSITFEDINDGTGTNAPGYIAGLAETALRVEAIRQLTGNAAPTNFEYAQPYLDWEFTSPNNKGHVMLQVLGGGTVPLSFKKKSDQTGGFISPSMDIRALSRKAGPVGGTLSKLADGSNDAADLFQSIDALIFGVFKLGDILNLLGLDEAPKFITQGLDVIEDFFATIEKLKKAANDLVNDVGTFANVLDTAIPAAVQAVSDILAAAVTLDTEAILEGVADLDGALSDIRDGIDAFNPAIASGLRAQLSLLVDQVRGVIASDIEPPLMAFASAQELAKNQIVRLEWRPKIQGFLGIFDPQDPYGLLLSVEARAKDLPGKPAGVDLLASLTDFNLNLIGSARFMILKFQRLQFKVASNKKPEIDVVFDDLIFDGCLAFVQKLRELIPLEGFSDPPNVDISTEGITAGFTLAIPGVAVGMFSLENLSLSAGFKIPFVGPPLSVNFAFCTRESPFILTVSMIGGGGFFGITINPNGIELLEASLEAGACLSIDLGVASGSVSIMLGIYFRMEGSEASLTGYLRIRGEVDVLGFITASIELRMELTYEFSSHKCVGRASIEIEVSVFCFSASVTIEAERKFSGSNDDPTFKELMEPIGNYKPFSEYVLAFAA